MNEYTQKYRAYIINACSSRKLLAYYTKYILPASPFLGINITVVYVYSSREKSTNMSKILQNGINRINFAIYLTSIEFTCWKVKVRYM